MIVGDFSNGNDAVFLKDKGTLADIKGQKVNLVEYSVSEYLLARALESIGSSEKDVTVVNTADPDMVGAFQTPDVTAMVTWNPMVSEIAKLPNAHKVFDSTQVPGEIIDMMVANTDTLKDNPNFGKALAGIWYDTMALMTAGDAAADAAKTAMGTASGTDLAGYNDQLAATKLFAMPADAVAFIDSPDLKKTMDLVRTFLFDKGLLGSGAASADVIGIELPGGEVLGDAGNVKLRFADTYMKAAADGRSEHGRYPAPRRAPDRPASRHAPDQSQAEPRHPADPGAGAVRPAAHRLRDRLDAAAGGKSGGQAAAGTRRPRRRDQQNGVRARPAQR